MGILLIRSWGLGRRYLRTCSALLFLLGLFPGSSALPAATQPSIRLVDDRGQPVDERVEVCFELDLKQSCKPAEPGKEILPPADFHRVLAEGADHGPVAVASKSLKLGPAGALLIELPRKALLRVTGAPAGELTLSLYDPYDTTFRSPKMRALVHSGEVKIPAGSFIGSFAAKGFAPDLQRVSAQPGAQVRATYHARNGWSLLVRCQSAIDGKIVAQTRVSVAETPGYGRPFRPRGEAITGSDGIALFSGLDSALAGLRAESRDFVPAEVGGLTASPGTFTFRDVPLNVGGRLRTTVTLHGRRLPGIKCQVLAYDLSSMARNATPKILWEGRADKQGVCRSGRLAPGLYKLRLFPAAERVPLSRWVTVPENQEIPEEVALAPARVTGEVRRSGNPAIGYTISALSLDADRPSGAVADSLTAETDDSGKYELTLWEPGRYGFFLRAPSKTAAPNHKELTLYEDDDQRLDFELQAGSYRGTVVDESSRPVEGAHVALRLAGLYTTVTDSAGKFEFPATDEGTVTLTARKAGYRDSEPMAVTIQSGAEPAEVTLVLKKKETQTGTILAAMGTPVAGAWVGSIANDPVTGPRLYRETQTDEAGTFEIEMPPGSVGLFASGPGCPLSRFDLVASPSEDEAAHPTLRCVDQAAAFELTLVDAKGQPVPHAGLILRLGDAVVPGAVLMSHLSLLGLPAQTDGSGHLVVAGISPGHYDLFLSATSSELTVATGLKQGFLTSIDLAPLATTELQATATSDPSADPAAPAKRPSDSVP